MTLETTGVALIESDPDVVAVRHLVRQLTTNLGFSLVDQTKMVTAASELARNVLIYGMGGEVQWELVTTMTRRGLKLTFVDQGPGIEDLQKAMSDGWTSGSGLGMGLPGTRRLVNEFDIQSEPGKGTKVTIVRWK